MKKARVGAALAGVGIVLATAVPSQAAGPYTIKTSRATPLDTAFAFQQSGCKAEVATSPANGVDTAIINVGSLGFAGKAVAIPWTGNNTVGKAAFIGGGLLPRFFNGTCGELFNNSLPSGMNPGTWRLTIPTGTKWLTVASNGLVDVSFSMNVLA